MLSLLHVMNFRINNGCRIETMIRENIKYFTIFFVSVLFHSSAMAGFAGGPYAIFMNLSNNEKMDRVIADQFDERERCSYLDAILFMREGPIGITKPLVRNALINKDKQSIKFLNYLLRKPHQDLIEGFDGVIAYTELPSPRFIRLSTGDPITATRNIKLPVTNDSVWKAFCVLMPQIRRNP